MSRLDVSQLADWCECDPAAVPPVVRDWLQDGLEYREVDGLERDTAILHLLQALDEEMPKVGPQR